MAPGHLHAPRQRLWLGLIVCAVLAAGCGDSGGSEGSSGTPGTSNATSPDQDASMGADGSITADTGQEEDTGTSESDAPGDTPDTDDPPGDVGDPSEATADVFERLRPTCEGCHLDGTSFPAFAGLESFQSLIVGNVAFVVPGDADSSELVRLLVGEGTRQFAQMPIGQQNFLDLEQAGQTRITIAEIRAWIGELNQEPVPVDKPEPVLVRRMTAEQIQTALYAQLGLSDADFFSVNANTGEIGSANRNRYPMHSPDAPPYIHPNSGSHSQLRFMAFGGPNHLGGTPRNQELSPLMGHTLTQVAQAWCRLSYDKEGNDALFARASRSDTSADNAEALRANIRYLFLRMLGVVATDAEVDDLYTSVFLPYESQQDTRTAWVTVCASMVRDPLWLTY